MQRLRPLSESECYLRCYGERDLSVTLVEIEPRGPSRPELSDPVLLARPLPDAETAAAGWQPLALLAQAD